MLWQVSSISSSMTSPLNPSPLPWASSPDLSSTFSPPNSHPKEDRSKVYAQDVQLYATPQGTLQSVVTIPNLKGKCHDGRRSKWHASTLSPLTRQDFRYTCTRKFSISKGHSRYRIPRSISQGCSSSPYRETPRPSTRQCRRRPQENRPAITPNTT